MGLNKIRELLKENDINFNDVVEIKKDFRTCFKKLKIQNYNLSSLNKKNRIKGFKLYVRHTNYTVWRIAVYKEHFYKVLLCCFVNDLFMLCMM